MSTSDFPRRLKTARDERGWSQEELADKIEVNERTIGRWETGEGVPQRPQQMKLAKVFGMSREELGLVKDTRNDAQNGSLQSIIPTPTIIPKLLQGQQRDQAKATLTLDEQSRSNTLAVLHKEYTNVLATSLQETVPIEPRLHERFDLSHPHRVTTPPPGYEEQELPVGTSIASFYDEKAHGGGLLILGDPGAGKTILLYKLALHLHQRATFNKESPLPIVLNLSSWAQIRQPLHEWIMKELMLRYFIPQKLGQRWMQEEHLLLLLDGLDEVIPSVYTACIEAINAYRADHFRGPVVCSRLEEYIRQGRRLALQCAVVIQPLSMTLIEAYLVKIGKPMAALREIIHTNIVLRELLTTPLMLSIIIRTYHNKAVADLPQMGTSEEQQQEVFARYLQQCLQAPNKSTHYSPKQMQKWLVWLAFQMKQHNQSLLYVEQLQPDLLPQGWPQRCYHLIGIYLPHMLMGIALGIVFVSFFFKYNLYGIISSGAYGGIIAGLLSYRSLSGRFSSSMNSVQQWLPLLKRASLLGLIWSLIIGADSLYLGQSFPFIIYNMFFFGAWMLLLALLILGETSSFLPLLSFYKEEGKQTSSRRSLFPLIVPKQFLVKVGRITLVSGLCIGLDAGFHGGKHLGLVSALQAALSSGLNYGLINGLIFAALMFLIGTETLSIPLKEKIIWSLKRLRQALTAPNHLRNVLFLSSAAVFVVGLSNGLNNGLGAGLGGGLVWGFCIGGIYWLLAGLLQSISSDQYQPHQRLQPNQGIQDSGLNGLLIGCVGGFIATVICGGSIILSDALSTGLSDVLSIGLRTGLSAGLSYGFKDGLGYAPWLMLAIGLFLTLMQGGLTWWRHWVLRVLLWMTGLLPLRLVHFLDAAATRVLLYKIGGGYRFIHDLFRDFLTL